MTAVSSSMPFYSMSSPLTSLEENFKFLDELKDKLDARFGVKYVRELNEEEHARRNAILKAPQELLPNPSLDISILKIAVKDIFNYFPILYFSIEEVLHFLIPRLHKHGVTKIPPFFSGGFARHCLAESSFQDLDLTFFVEKEEFRLILHLIRDLIETKLRSMDVKLDFSSPEIFEFIESIYLYKKKALKDEKNHPIASLISLGKIEFKFVLAKNYRYYVANYERFLVPITHNSLFFAHPESSYFAEKSTQAFEDLIFGEFAVDQPQAVSDFLFRMTHATTQGFGMRSPNDLLPAALNLFVKAYPIENAQGLMQKLHSHLDNHYGDTQGQMIDFVNLLSFLQGIEHPPLRHHYIQILSKALNNERECGKLRLTKGKELESYANLVLPLSKKTEEEPQNLFKFSGLLFKTSIESFKPLSTLLEQHPEASPHVITLIQSLFFYEWIKKNPKISFDSTKIHWQLTLTTTRGAYSLSMPTHSIEERILHTMHSWRELEKFATIFEQIVKGFELSSFAFTESNKNPFFLEMLQASESARIHSLISFKKLKSSSTMTQEEIIKEMSAYLDKEMLDQWHLQTRLRTLSNGHFKEKEEAISLLIALLRHRIRKTSWNFGIEDFAQMNRRLQSLKTLPEKRELIENPALLRILSKCFLLLLSKVQAPVEMEYFLEICHFRLFATRLGILEAKNSIEIFSLSKPFSDFQRSKEDLLIENMFLALLEESPDKSQHLFCNLIEILCSFESVEKEMPEALTLFKRLSQENFRERSPLMRQFICQLAQMDWRIADKYMALCQAKMKEKDSIQSLYTIMKAQILSAEIEALEKASVTWLSNKISTLNLFAHLLIGMKLLKNYLMLSNLDEEKKEYLQKITYLLSHFNGSIREGYPLFKQFPTEGIVKIKAELQTLIATENTSIAWKASKKSLQKSLKDFFSIEGASPPTISQQQHLAVEKKEAPSVRASLAFKAISNVKEQELIGEVTNNQEPAFPRSSKSGYSKKISFKQKKLDKEERQEKMRAFSERVWQRSEEDYLVKKSCSSIFKGVLRGCAGFAGSRLSQACYVLTTAEDFPFPMRTRLHGTRVLAMSSLKYFALPTLMNLIFKRSQRERKEWILTLLSDFLTSYCLDSMGRKWKIVNSNSLTSAPAIGMFLSTIIPVLLKSDQFFPFSWMSSCLTVSILSLGMESITMD